MTAETNYSTISVNGHNHVLIISDTRDNSNMPAANYRNTGKALCGVMRKGETLEQFLERKR